MIRVEGYNNLYRDEETGAIINTDSTGYDNYVKSLERDDLKKKELDKIKGDIDEIKSLLKDLLNKQGK
jgi:hypothetical protein|tara:strand:+ start:6186 stop:6389 length:204 start_codon:yes stop_codon:yes gene_type:complete